MTARTISADDLETMAFAAHAPIEPPGPEGGWAVAVINGREYRARVGAAASFVEQVNCVNYPRVPCLCRGAMRNGGPFCARRREIEQAARRRGDVVAPVERAEES